jgi:hypothetical protein
MATTEIGGAQMGINPDGFGGFVRGIFGQIRGFLSGIFDFIRPILSSFGINIGENNPLDRIFGAQETPEGMEDRSRPARLSQTNGSDSSADGVVDVAVRPDGTAISPPAGPPAGPPSIIEVDPDTGQPWPGGRRPDATADISGIAPPVGLV